MQIGLIGAGTMGLGIAQVFAKYDEFNVFLCGSDINSSKRAYERLEKETNFKKTSN